MPRRITNTTDKQHIGTLIEVPEVGGVLTLGDAEFRVIRIEPDRIVCFNYIVDLEPGDGG